MEATIKSSLEKVAFSIQRNREEEQYLEERVCVGGIADVLLGLNTSRNRMGGEIYQNNWESSKIPHPSFSPKQLGGKGNAYID